MRVVHQVGYDIFILVLKRRTPVAAEFITFDWMLWRAPWFLWHPWDLISGNISDTQISSIYVATAAECEEFLVFEVGSTTVDRTQISRKVNAPVQRSHEVLSFDCDAVLQPTRKYFPVFFGYCLEKSLTRAAFLSASLSLKTGKRQKSHDARSGLLGDSGGVVNSLDFCLASLKSLCCFYFRCVLSSQWMAVTVNMRILHCQL